MLNSNMPREMTPKDLTTAIVRNPIIVSPNTPVREAIARMNEARSPDEAVPTAQPLSNHGQLDARASCVVVVESQSVIGILTEQDVVRFVCASPQRLDEVPVRQVMTAPVPTLRESALTNLFSAIRVLQQNHIRQLPIVDEQDCLVGLVTHETLLQKQLQREQIVADLAAQIRFSLSLQTILDTAVVQIHQAMGCDRVNIWQLEPDLSTVVVAESTDSPQSLMGERVRDECYQQHITQFYREGHVRVVPDIYTAKMSDCHREFLISLGTRAKILLPLFCGEHLWGLLNVSESEIVRDWQTDEIDFLRKLATQLTIAIQQSATHEQLQAELQERQQTETCLQIKNDLLARVAAQEPLADTLNHACTAIEEILDGALCSILLLDSNNKLRDGAAPSLPNDYRRQIDGVQVGEAVGSCGTAVHRREQVIVADIAHDPLWENFKDLALSFDLRACWSTPIVDSDQAILGTFALYYREVRSPRADELALVDSLVQIIMLAIQRHQN
ncbi:MAG: GAF domain-containing protein, partial [Leptolyngbyaceae bacterium]|nr:GAF domain-containing protein [Leptolyngbyaceae bacterium]